MPGQRQLVIIGGGQAACQLALHLRQAGFDGALHMICREPHIPYQRPPLSKGFLAGSMRREALDLKPANWYRDHEIELHTGCAARAIDRRERTVTLGNGRVLRYDRLALATGARAAPLPVMRGAFLNLFTLRSVDDSERLREALAHAGQIVIVGGGFIGLEIAATACHQGKAVTVIEAQPRLMARAVCAAVSDFFARHHTASGCNVVSGATVQQVSQTGDTLHAVVLDDGRKIGGDMFIVGVGAPAEMTLAGEAGLECGPGIFTDPFCTTSDPHIFALGDCAAQENAVAGRRIRLESVQNATDQAQCAAQNMLGGKVAYRAVPWFWSDQGAARLQIAGLSDAGDEVVMRGGADDDTQGFTAFRLRAGRLVAAESVNRPRDYLAARKLIEAGIAPDREMLADKGFNLKSLLVTNM